MAPSRKALEDGYMEFEEGSDRVRLIGSYSAAADMYFFPTRLRCPVTGEPVEDRLLSSDATIYSWTYVDHPLVGRVRYSDAKGYGVIQGDLPEGVRIQAVMVDGDAREWTIGDPVELVAYPVSTDEDGIELCTFAFRPAKGDAR